MTKVTIYHNPRCSKYAQTMAFTAGEAYHSRHHLVSQNIAGCSTEPWFAELTRDRNTRPAENFGRWI